MYEAVPLAQLETFEAEDGDLASENKILRDRVADLEAAVAAFKGQLRDTKKAAFKKRPRDESSAPQDVKPAKLEDGGVYYGRSLYLGESAAPNLLQRMMSLVPENQGDVLRAFSGGANAPHSSASANVFMFPTIFPAHNCVKEMLSILGSLGRHAADDLLEAFYQIVDPLYHYAPTPWIMERYESCWNPNSTPESLPTPQAAALIFAVLALGDLVSTKTNTWFFIAASMQCLRISNFFQAPCTDTIHTFCFIGVYLQHEGRLNEYWPILGFVIRLAQSMALHRDPDSLPNLPKEEGEIRRRLFYTLAAQETALSVMWGRPNGITFADCKMPKNISDEELYANPVDSKSTEGDYEITYNRATWLIGDITRDLIAASETSDLARVKAMESRIWTCYDNFPAFLKFDPTFTEPDVFFSRKSKKQYVQSIVLYIIVNHNILVLYRKSMLSFDKPTTRKPCFEAAFAIAKAWKILQDSFPKMARICWMHWFRAFHAALICLVVIRADGSQSEYRPTALECWHSFLYIFSRVKDQNESIMCCWRALNRLDAVLKKDPDASDEVEVGSDKPEHRKAHKLANNLPGLMTGDEQPAQAPSQSRNPFSPTEWTTTRSTWMEKGRMGSTDGSSDGGSGSHVPSLQSFDGTPGENQSGRLPATPNAVPNGPGSEKPQDAPVAPPLDIFDMDTQNWPAWLVDESPT